MTQHDPETFYNAMADDYHLIFADWQRSVQRQGAALHTILSAHMTKAPPATRILDCACGIGTQALGLAGQGYQLTATDISAVEIERAKVEAEKRGLSLDFSVADMRTLDQQLDAQFDGVYAFDNAIPHLLTDGDLAQAAAALYAVTAPAGLFAASIRDYDALLQERPTLMSQRVLDDGARITFQHWAWESDLYTVTQFIMMRTGDAWAMRHYTTRYRALQRATLTAALETAGFVEVRWLSEAERGPFQPVVIAKRLA